MSEKRRDNRNRILHEGEYQRADGRYRKAVADQAAAEGWEKLEKKREDLKRYENRP